MPKKNEKNDETAATETAATETAATETAATESDALTLLMSACREMFRFPITNAPTEVRTIKDDADASYIAYAIQDGKRIELKDLNALDLDIAIPWALQALDQDHAFNHNIGLCVRRLVVNALRQISNDRRNLVNQGAGSLERQMRKLSLEAEKAKKSGDKTLWAELTLKVSKLQTTLAELAMQELDIVVDSNDDNNDNDNANAEV